MSMENNQAGVVVGFTAGGYEGVMLIAQDFTLISIEILIQAGVLAFIGGVVGWMGSELMNQIKRAYLKGKQQKHDKKNK